MKQIFINDLHDYDYSEEIVDNGINHIFFRSNAEHWTSHVRGKEVISILDTGNGLIFNHSKLKKEIDYDYAFELGIMLRLLTFEDQKIEISTKKLL
jgi:hypothetical protein